MKILIMLALLMILLSSCMSQETKEYDTKGRLRKHIIRSGWRDSSDGNGKTILSIPVSGVGA